MAISRRFKSTRKLYGGTTPDKLPEELVKLITERAGKRIKRPLMTRSTVHRRAFTPHVLRTLKNNQEHAQYCECRGKFGIKKQNFDLCCDNVNNYAQGSKKTKNKKRKTKKK